MLCPASRLGWYPEPFWMNFNPRTGWLRFQSSRLLEMRPQGMHDVRTQTCVSHDAVSILVCSARMYGPDCGGRRFNPHARACRPHGGNHRLRDVVSILMCLGFSGDSSAVSILACWVALRLLSYVSILTPCWGVVVGSDHFLSSSVPMVSILPHNPPAQSSRTVLPHGAPARCSGPSGADHSFLLGFNPHALWQRVRRSWLGAPSTTRFNPHAAWAGAPAETGHTSTRFQPSRGLLLALPGFNPKRSGGVSVLPSCAGGVPVSARVAQVSILTRCRGAPSFSGGRSINGAFQASRFLRGLRFQALRFLRSSSGFNPRAFCLWLNPPASCFKQ